MCVCGEAILITSFVVKIDMSYKEIILEYISKEYDWSITHINAHHMTKLCVVAYDNIAIVALLTNSNYNDDR